MSKRLDQESEKKLTPIRMQYALDQIANKGYECFYDEKSIEFNLKGNKITL